MRKFVFRGASFPGMRNQDREPGCSLSTGRCCHYAGNKRVAVRPSAALTALRGAARMHYSADEQHRRDQGEAANGSHYAVNPAPAVPCTDWIFVDADTGHMIAWMEQVQAAGP
jgi:hypothetical protein